MPTPTNAAARFGRRHYRRRAGLAMIDMLTTTLAGWSRASDPRRNRRLARRAAA